MSKIWISILVLALVCLSSAGDCFGEDCAFEAGGNPDQQATVADIIPIVDKEIRRVYWYYLRRAHLVYQANLEVPERFIHFFIYRNVVGTFLVIASWDKSTQSSEINTFVRLGNGFDQDIQTPYSPVNIQPFIISLRLANGEYLIEIDESGDFKVNGKLIGSEEGEDQKIIDADAKTKVVDEYIRKTYWYYLRSANLIHNQHILTSFRAYIVLTYVNIVGTFLVIGSCDADDNIQVNTFVRLGAGAATIEEVQPIEMRPAVIELSSY